MNIRLINEILMHIFLDYFYITTSILVLLTGIVIAYRYLKINLPLIIPLSIWYLVVSMAVLIFAFLIVNFYSTGPGLDRLASIPLLLATSPLFVCFLILVFIYPRKI